MDIKDLAPVVTASAMIPRMAVWLESVRDGLGRDGGGTTGAVATLASSRSWAMSADMACLRRQSQSQCVAQVGHPGLQRQIVCLTHRSEVVEEYAEGAVLSFEDETSRSR